MHAYSIYAAEALAVYLCALLDALIAAHWWITYTFCFRSPGSPWMCSPARIRDTHCTFSNLAGASRSVCPHGIKRPCSLPPIISITNRRRIVSAHQHKNAMALRLFTDPILMDVEREVRRGTLQPPAPRAAAALAAALSKHHSPCMAVADAPAPLPCAAGLSRIRALHCTE